MVSVALMTEMRRQVRGVFERAGDGSLFELTCKMSEIKDRVFLSLQVIQHDSVVEVDESRPSMLVLISYAD